MADLLAAEVSLSLADLARFNLPYGASLGSLTTFVHPLIRVMVAVLWTVLAASSDLYVRLGQRRQFGALATTTFLFNLTLAGSLYFTFREVSRLFSIYFMAFQFCFLSIIRILLHIMKGKAVHRTVIIGLNIVSLQLEHAIQIHEHFTQLLGYIIEPEHNSRYHTDLPILGTTDDLLESLAKSQASDVIVALCDGNQNAILEKLCRAIDLPVRIRLVPDLTDVASIKANFQSLEGIPLIGIRVPAITGLDWLLKRSFDVLVALVSLCFLSPILLLIAVLIKLQSKGPVLFRQQRVGENGKLFQMYKFRSMVEHAEDALQKVAKRTSEGKILHKLPDDPRVTRFGRFLRHYSLDELPQLFNVLKGEMSIVGPRPELPLIVQQYESWQYKRLVMPPGITGWWQISGRSELPMHLNTKYDLYYISNYSFFLDLTILIKTVKAVLAGRGAY